MNMNVFQHLRRLLAIVTLALVLMTTSVACGNATQQDRVSLSSSAERSLEYGQLARGDTLIGQNFGDWVVRTSQGLIQDAYVRDNDKLGVVISPNVRPKEVKALAQSLVQGFERSTPNRDLTVMVYAPDKKLILTARYDASSKQIDYSA
jgi:hypothetical protein